MNIIAQYRSAEIPKSIASFRKIDYADERLYINGILRESIENHFWLIENSGKNLASVYCEMKTSVDMLLQSLAKDEEKLNLVVSELLKLLEERSLYDVAEHLSLKLLNNKKYKIQAELEKQLERYRSMKVGQKAPDFSLKVDVYSASIPKKRFQKACTIFSRKIRSLYSARVGVRLVCPIWCTLPTTIRSGKRWRWK